jgi:hypothetical protein
MVNSSVHKQLFPRNKFSSAGLLALAFLLLVVSCPLKRILQINFAPVSSAIKIHKAITQYNSTTYSTASCYKLKEKAVLVKANLVTQQVSSPLFLLAFHSSQGLGDSFSLTGILQSYHHLNIPVPPGLPLFLQHRRLLI